MAQPPDRRSTFQPKVVRHGRASSQARFQQPLVLKQGNIFLLCAETGDVEPNSDQGLYFHDVRHLSAETLRLSGVRAVSLLADASLGHRGLFELSNPDIQDDEGHTLLRKETLGVHRQKTLGEVYQETITLRNYLQAPAEITINLSFDADFKDMFAIRGTPPGKRGHVRPCRWHDESIVFRYDGADGHQRSTILHLSQPPDEHDGGDLTYRVRLKGRSGWTLEMTAELRDEYPGPLESAPRTEGCVEEQDRLRQYAALPHPPRRRLGLVGLA